MQKKKEGSRIHPNPNDHASLSKTPYKKLLSTLTPIAAAFAGYLTMRALLKILEITQQKAFAFYTPLILGTPAVGTAKMVLYSDNIKQTGNTSPLLLAFFTSAAASAIIAFKFLPTHQPIISLAPTMILMAEFRAAQQRVTNQQPSILPEDHDKSFSNPNSNVTITHVADNLTKILAALTWGHIMANKLSSFHDIKDPWSRVIYLYFILTLTSLYTIFYSHTPQKANHDQRDIELQLPEPIITPDDKNATDVTKPPIPLNSTITTPDLSDDSITTTEDPDEEGNTPSPEPFQFITPYKLQLK